MTDTQAPVPPPHVSPHVTPHASPHVPPYVVQRGSHSRFLPVRGLRYHLRTWGIGPAGASVAQGGPPAHEATGGAPLPGQGPVPLVLLHGWMDVSASFQFMVDALNAGFMEGRAVVAPDWRGFGLTDRSGTDSYWFPDYLADLDALLQDISPDQPVDLLGHSMGGNVAMLYAGVRPHRVRRLVNLEGFGMPSPPPARAPARYGQWLDELRQDIDLRSYARVEDVATRLCKTNPRLQPARAAWLAAHWAQPNALGQWEILGDPAHKRANPQLYRKAEALACWRRITAPVLCVVGDDTAVDHRWKGRYTLAEFYQRIKVVKQVRHERLAQAGHMLHHDQPEALAALLQGFLAG